MRWLAPSESLAVEHPRWLIESGRLADELDAFTYALQYVAPPSAQHQLDSVTTLDLLDSIPLLPDLSSRHFQEALQQEALVRCQRIKPRATSRFERQPSYSETVNSLLTIDFEAVPVSEGDWRWAYVGAVVCPSTAALAGFHSTPNDRRNRFYRQGLTDRHSLPPVAPEARSYDVTANELLDLIPCLPSLTARDTLEQLRSGDRLHWEQPLSSGGTLARTQGLRFETVGIAGRYYWQYRGCVLCA